SAVQNKRTGEPPRRQERQGLFLNTILRGLGCECFLLGAPVGRSAKPVRANAQELFFAGPQRNIMIYLATLGALGVLAVFLRPILEKSVRRSNNQLSGPVPEKGRR
ncbi:MAG TPA: hypothetical protein VM658_06040, partial [bacterium]|nr:hypothetical protein [bacterium]